MRRSVIWTNVALAVAITGICLAIGWWEYLLIQLPTVMLAGTAGVWLFYVQHQFEDVYWENSENWSYTDAALQGSSYLKLPQPLQFFTGNIGLHHVHHLNARIPNYNLQRAHDDNEIFHQVPILTFWQGIRCVRLKLWDEKRGRLVTFAEARRHAREERVAGRAGIGERRLAADAGAAPIAGRCCYRLRHGRMFVREVSSQSLVRSVAVRVESNLPNCPAAHGRERSTQNVTVICRSRHLAPCREPTHQAGDHRSVPHSERRRPGRPGRARCPGPVTHRVGQDARVRRTDHRSDRIERPPTGGADPGPDPGAGGADRRRGAAARERARSEHLGRVRRGRHPAADQAGPQGAPAGRNARAACSTCSTAARSPWSTSRSWSSTRPTGCSTWASARTSSAS